MGCRTTKFSNPVLLDNVFWDNRAGTWTAAGVTGIGLPATPHPCPAWDVGTIDGSGTPKMYGSVYDSERVERAVPRRQRLQRQTTPATGNSRLAPTGPSNSTPRGSLTPYDIKVTVASWRTFPGFRPAAIVTLDLPVEAAGRLPPPCSSTDDRPSRRRRTQ